MTAPDWSHATVLSTTEFEVGWAACGPAETPWQLDPPREGRSPSERRAVVDGVARSPEWRGLGDHRGPRPHMRFLFDVLARPDQECDIRYRADALVAGVAARRGGDAVLAVRHGREIALLEVPPSDAIPALVGLPGATARGPGREIVVAASALDAARATRPADGSALAAALQSHGVPQLDAQALGQVYDEPAVLRGQCSAAVRAGGRSRRAPSVVGFHRTRSGSYGHLRHGATVRIAPADHDDITDALTALFAA